MHLINDNLQKIIALCKKHKVNKLYAFGSILTNRFTDKSDVDMLVDFNSEIDHNTYADNFFEFYYSLKALFGRDVDLVDESAVSNPYFKDELEDANIMMEFGGYWFYKAPGVKFVDLMSYFFENSLEKPADMKLRFFCPPKDGLNYPEDGTDPYSADDGDWLTNSYSVLPKLPEIRIEQEPVALFKHYDD